MPKIIMLEKSAQEIKDLIQRTGKTRAEIGSLLNVGIDAIQKWVSNGKISKAAWYTLTRVVVEKENPELSRDLKIYNYGNSQAPGLADNILEDFINGGPIKLELKNNEITKDTLKETSTENLVTELENRGWKVTLTRTDNPST